MAMEVLSTGGVCLAGQRGYGDLLMYRSVRADFNKVAQLDVEIIAS